MNHTDAEKPAETHQSSWYTSFVVLGADGVIKSASTAAADILLGTGAEGSLFYDKISEAAKVGRISQAAVARIVASVKNGAGTFQTEDGRTFLLRTHTLQNGSRAEWTDVSMVVADADVKDPITGLPTRTAFLEAIDRLPDHGPGVLVVHLALDNINDIVEMFGGTIAHHLSRRAAERIAGQVDAANAYLSSVNAGEFLFLASENDGPELTAALLDILGRPYLIDGKMIYSTASIGIAAVEGSDAEIVLRNTSLALREARRQGAGQACTFTTDMRDAVERKRMLETELRKALALRQFSLAYQPQYQVDGRRLVGFEALLRWNHPDHGAVSPAEFIPLAEELGLILPIGEWVLRTACKKAATWPAEISISVNVSPLQFRSPTIVSTVTAALGMSCLDPTRLDLEITEGAILMNSAPIMETFRQLKAIGVRFSMDDFGTGYSSLSYLQKFPFDKIKIDQSFVRSLSASSDSLAIIRAICALGKTLGLTTIAEGVETEDQMAQIQKKGCQQVQGYLTGRPLTADLADELIAANN